MNFKSILFWDRTKIYTLEECCSTFELREFSAQGRTICRDPLTLLELLMQRAELRPDTGRRFLLNNWWCQASLK